MAKNPAVLRAYDAIYFLAPFQEAVCQKDASGNYCLVDTASSSSNAHSKRSSSLNPRDSQTPLFVNMDGYGQKNVAFLGMTPNLSSGKLCQPCTRNVMNAYTTQLNTIPYAPGIMNSIFLSGLSALDTAITSQCGASFLSGQVVAAGALAKSAAARGADSTIALLGSVIMGVAAGAIAVS